MYHASCIMDSDEMQSVTLYRCDERVTRKVTLGQNLHC